MSDDRVVHIELRLGEREGEDGVTFPSLPFPWDDWPTRLRVAGLLRIAADTMEQAPAWGTPEWDAWLANRPYAQLDLGNVVFIDDRDRLRLAEKSRLPPPPPRR